MSFIQFHSDLALHLAKPHRQVEVLRKLLIKQGIPFNRRLTLRPPAFTPQTDTEVLLLTFLLPGSDTLTPTAETLKWLWGAFPDSFNVSMNVNLATTSDITGEDDLPGFHWVGFDPMGMVFHEEEDFRADILVQKDVSRIPPLNASQPYRDMHELASIEAFMAMHLMSRLIHEAWDGLTIILPRLEVTPTTFGSSPGVIGFNLFENRLNGWVTGWYYNYYGHLRAVPTIRKLT